MELLWRDSLTCPTEEEYIAMVNDSRSSFRAFDTQEQGTWS